MSDTTVDFDANIFKTINNFAQLRGFYNKYNREAINWYRDQVSKIQVGRMQLLSDNQIYQHNKPGPGHFCFFFYSAKGYGEGTLPYYDTSPMSLILGQSGNIVSGLNFHYLPLNLRVLLFQQILAIEGGSLSEVRKLSATYEIIKGMTNLYKPCYKNYLLNHIKSQAVWVPIDSSLISIFLPVANFRGASQTKVYADSRKLIV